VMTKVQVLTLTEIGERINRHLKRIEAEHKKTKAYGTATGRTFWNAGAHQSGARVRVRYIAYQHGANLTREQALHYLAALDAGFDRSHYEYFHDNPPPKADEPEAQYLAIVRGRFGYFLYEVTKRTDKRVYGRGVEGGSWAPSFVDRDSVLKFNATHEQFDRLIAAEEQRDIEISEARARFEKVREEILGAVPEKQNEAPE
jgi:hypothetical protein